MKRIQIFFDEFTGLHLRDLRIRERTGCSVIAVERRSSDNKELVVTFDSDFFFQPSDIAYICGTSQGVRQFSNIFVKN